MKNYLAGEKIGSLTVIEETDERINGCIAWKCRCDCGNEVLVESRKLSSGKITSCGCISERYPRNIEGIRFGKLIPIRALDKRTKTGYVIWECKCDCGNTVEVSRNNLIQGMTRSCGCVRKSHSEDIIGTVFGSLLVTDVKEKKGSYVVCRVRCVCGREFNIRKGELLSGKTTSCGCKDNRSGKKVDFQRLDYPIQGRIPKSSFSGYRGVSYNAKRDKWVARIMKNGISYNLGSYSDITDAVNARVAKEMELV